MSIYETYSSFSNKMGVLNVSSKNADIDRLSEKEVKAFEIIRKTANLNKKELVQITRISSTSIDTYNIY